MHLGSSRFQQRDGDGAAGVVQVVKNKCAPPFKAAEFDIMFGSGISSLGCLLDAAEGVGIVQRKGAWYSFGEQRIGQGREKSMAALKENPQLAK